MKSSFVIKTSFTLLFLFFSAFSSFAAMNIDQNGVAVKGYDVVAYFSEGKAVKGIEAHRYTVDGVNWFFSTEKNKNLFLSKPHRYAPQYGGFCAYAISKGAKADVDPTAWSIHKGKLYLNYSKQIRTRWQQGIEANIRQADLKWPSLN